MEAFFKKHPDLTLTSAIVFLLVMLIGYYFWGITALVTTLNQAINAQQLTSPPSSFDLAGARALNLKGLTPQTAPAATSTTP